MAKYTVAFCVLAVAATAWGYSGGAPESVCEDMIPKHPVQPQKTPFPFTVSLSKKEIKSGDAVEITIGGKSFKGFLLQVRDGSKAVGSFQIPDTDKYSKTINCHGNPKSAATHKNSAEKNNLKLLWKAPAGLKGNFKVYATVAQDGGTFWAAQPTQSLKVN